MRRVTPLITNFDSFARHFKQLLGRICARVCVLLFCKERTDSNPERGSARGRAATPRGWEVVGSIPRLRQTPTAAGLQRYSAHPQTKGGEMARGRWRVERATTLFHSSQRTLATLKEQIGHRLIFRILKCCKTARWELVETSKRLSVEHLIKKNNNII